MSFEEAYKNYLIYATRRHKKQGLDTLTRNLNLHVFPFFKDKNINELSKIDILKWQDYILDKNFSNNFNRNLYYEFSAFMNYCVLFEIIPVNIVLQVEKFKKKYEFKEYHVYNIWQFRWFRFHLDNFVIKQYFNFMYFYGTRPGEAMALRFSDIYGLKVHIRHNIHRHGNRELDTPKNQSSVRTIKISVLMKFRILLLKRYYISIYGKCDYDYYLFGGIKPLAPTTIDRHKENACNRAHIQKITQHEFRHSYATRMIRKKKPINDVSKSMGHSTVSMTVDVYLH